MEINQSFGTTCLLYSRHCLYGEGGNRPSTASLNRAAGSRTQVWLRRPRLQHSPGTGTRVRSRVLDWKNIHGCCHSGFMMIYRYSWWFKDGSMMIHSGFMMIHIGSMMVHSGSMVVLMLTSITVNNDWFDDSSTTVKNDWFMMVNDGR